MVHITLTEKQVTIILKALNVLHPNFIITEITELLESTLKNKGNTNYPGPWALK